MIPNTRTEAGTIESVSRPDKDGLCSISVRPDWNGRPSQFTHVINWVPNEDLEQLNDGDRITLTLKRGRQKTTGDPPEDEKGWWWDYAAIQQGIEAGGAAHTPTQAPGTSGTASGYVTGEEMERRKDKRTALMQAGAIAVARMAMGTTDILEMASDFNHWLTGGIESPESPPTTPPAKKTGQPPAKGSEDPLAGDEPPHTDELRLS